MARYRRRRRIMGHHQTLIDTGRGIGDNFFLFNFEQNAIGFITDAVTGIALRLNGTDGTNPFLAAGKFDNSLYCNGLTNCNGDEALVTRVPSAVWDTDSYSGDWTIHFWIQFPAVTQTATAYVFMIQKEPYDSNNFVSVTISNPALTTPDYRVTGTASIGPDFVDTFFYEIPIASAGGGTDWHHVAMGRVGNNHYITIGGGAATVDSVLTTSYRDPAGKRTLVFGGSNGPSGNGRFAGAIDALQGYKGQLFDFVNGFTPPTLPPKL